VRSNIRLLYGFAFCDQFMIVIPLWVPYLATKGISMAQFMQLQAIFALVIVAAEVPTGLLSDRWGRKKVLLLGAILKAVGFSMLPFWTGYQGFLLYHLTMGIALAMISGGDIALLYESHLAAGGNADRSTAIFGNLKLAGQTGAAASALVGGAIVILSYRHLVWANAALSWIPALLALGVAEPARPARHTQRPAIPVGDILAAVLRRDAATRLVFVNMVAWGIAGLVMVWTSQKYWQDSGAPLAAFGVLYAAYTLLAGIGSRLAAAGAACFGHRAMLAATGVAPVIAYAGMAAFFSWGGILLGLANQLSYGAGQVLFLNALNERIETGMRATVISMASLGVRASFSLLGPLIGWGIDAWGLSATLAALAIIYAATFAGLLLPLIRRHARSPPGRRGAG
jgi:MFS family permease